MSGVLTAGALQLALQASGSLRGGNGTMSMKLNTVSDTVEFEAIFVGEFAYIREPGGDWQRVLREQVNTSGARLDSFEFLTSGDDLRYDGTTTYDGVDVHVLVNTGPLSLTGGETGQGASGEATRLRILLLADATPVFLSYHMTVSIDDGTGSKVAARGDIGRHSPMWASRSRSSRRPASACRYHVGRRGHPAIAPAGGSDRHPRGDAGCRA